MLFTHLLTKPHISYAISVCNEENEILHLIAFLIRYRHPKDEIVLLFDNKNGTEIVRNILKTYQNVPYVHWHEYPFEDHFANWKNRLKELCKGKWIFNLDADEMPSIFLMKTLRILTRCPIVDLILLPRINTVEGVTPADVLQYKWKINSKKWINWPDYQMRLFKNTPLIKWKNKVHEVPEGYRFPLTLPQWILGSKFALKHHKTIVRQRLQNQRYDYLIQR